MIATPSIEASLFRAGSVALGVVLLLAGPAFWVTAVNGLNEGLEERLNARVDFVLMYESEFTAEELRDAFDGYGIIAEIVTPNGETLRATPVTGALAFLDLPPGTTRLDTGRFLSQTAQWDDGTTITVYVSRARTNAVALRLLMQTAIVMVVAFAIGAVLVRRAARRAVRPVNELADMAQRIIAGESGLRAHPSNPSTPIGRVASLADQLLDQAEVSFARMENAESQTRQLLDNAAHQLRSPIAAVQATVDALLYEERPDVRERLRANLFRESERSGSLVEGLLRLAQIEQATAVQHGYTNLGLVARASVEHAQTLASDAITIESTVENCVRGIWVLDERAVREIIANLLDNASRHAISRVSLRIAPLANGVTGIRIIVCDDGPGVPIDQRQKVFERFASFGTHRGSGLGLPIARGLAQAMGGDIVCHGAEFEVKLPAVRVGPEPLIPGQTSDTLHHADVAESA
jgi:two-component system OmpR family sensor kinase